MARRGALAVGAPPRGRGAARLPLFLEVTRKLPGAASGWGVSSALLPHGDPRPEPGQQPRSRLPPESGGPRGALAPAALRSAAPRPAAGRAPRGRASPRGREFRTARGEGGNARGQERGRCPGSRRTPSGWAACERERTLPGRHSAEPSIACSSESPAGKGAKAGLRRRGVACCPG